MAGRAESINTLSIFGQLREHFGFPFGKRVFKFGDMPLELSDFLIEASEKSVFDGGPGIMQVLMQFPLRLDPLLNLSLKFGL